MRTQLHRGGTFAYSDAAFADACAEGRELTLDKAVDLAFDGRA